jgi:uncharacterized protein
MQKIIVDTNVIVSALISNSIPTKILYEIVFNEQAIICISADIYTEYVEVLSREKFNKFPRFKDKSSVVLAKIKEIGEMYEPEKQLAILSDAPDNRFLELADISSADFLITGNTQDFTIDEYEYTKIVTPREYWDKYKAIK